MDDNSLQNKLKNHDINDQVISEITNLITSGVITDTDLDDKVIEELKGLPQSDIEAVFGKVKEHPNIEHVSNKSALLSELIKDLKLKQKRGYQTVGGKRPGPDEAKLKEILERTNYSLDVTSGQRKYGGPPPNWNAPAPGPGHEIFCGKLPRDIFEDRLIPLFEECGTIWNLRLMIDPQSGFSKGFCFITYTTKEAANEAVKKFNGYEIEPDKHLKVNTSVANVRLFVGNIPKNKSREDILDEFRRQTEGLVDVIIYNSPDDNKKKNRGFSFLEYDSHKSASMAKHKIGSGYTRVWGCDIIVDWADPMEEPGEEVMSKVKVLYIRNLKSNVTDEQLREVFEKYGKIERVKKVKDYCFVHFEERDQAEKALQELQGTMVSDSEMEISWAKPPSENKQRDKRRLQFKSVCPRGAYDDSCIHYFYYPNAMNIPVRGGYGRGGRTYYMPRGSYRHPNPSYDSYTDNCLPDDLAYHMPLMSDGGASFRGVRGRISGQNNVSAPASSAPPTSFRGVYPMYQSMYTTSQWPATRNNNPQWVPPRR